LAERQLRNEKGTAAEEEARDTSKQIAEEGPVELEARPFFRSSRHTFFLNRSSPSFRVIPFFVRE